MYGFAESEQALTRACCAGHDPYRLIRCLPYFRVTNRSKQHEIYVLLTAREGAIPSASGQAACICRSAWLACLWLCSIHLSDNLRLVTAIPPPPPPTVPSRWVAWVLRCPAMTLASRCCRL